MAGVKNITVIPAKKRVGNTVTAEDKPKLKVVAYCRVGTDSEEQATSHDAQVTHYTEFIRKTLNGNLLGFMLMTVSVEQTLKSEKSSIE